MSSKKINSDIVKGSAWSLLSRIIQVLIKSGAVILLARYLGPSEFGLMMLVISISTIATAFIDIGISPATARLLAEEKGYNKKELIRKSVYLLFFTSILVLSICILGFPWLSSLLSAEALAEVNILVTLLIFGLILQKYLMKVFEGSRQITSFGKIYSIAGWLPWFLSFGFVLSFGESVYWAVGGYVAGYYILDFLLARKFKQFYDNQEDKGRSVGYKKILRYAVPMIATTASLYIYTQSDILLIQYFLGESAVGTYSAAIKLIEASMVGAMAIGNGSASYFPLVRNKGIKAFKNLIVNTTKTIKILYLPIIGAILLSSTEIIDLLYGVEYSSAYIILLIYMPYILFRSLSCVYSPALDYLGLADQRAIAVGISAILNVILNLFLIPLWGIEGAAIATQLTYSPLIIGYLVYMFKSVEITAIDYFAIYKIVFLVWLGSLSMGLVGNFYLNINSIIVAIIFGVIFLLANISLKEIKLKSLTALTKSE